MGYICFRNHGTAFTHSQRISVLMIRLLTSMAVGALFYGQSGKNVIGDISLTLYESLFSFIPVFILQQLIKRRRSSSKQIIESYKSKDEHTHDALKLKHSLHKYRLHSTQMSMSQNELPSLNSDVLCLT